MGVICLFGTKVCFFKIFTLPRRLFTTFHPNIANLLQIIYNFSNYEPDLAEIYTYLTVKRLTFPAEYGIIRLRCYNNASRSSRGSGDALPPVLPDPIICWESDLATISVKMDNPGKEINLKVDDAAILKLFTDTAETKTSVSLLWRVFLVGTGGTASLSLAGLIAQVS